MTCFVRITTAKTPTQKVGSVKRWRETSSRSNLNSVFFTEGEIIHMKTTLAIDDFNGGTLSFGADSCADLQSHEILEAKTAADLEWDKLHKLPAWRASKGKCHQDVINEARVNNRKVHFAKLMDSCHLKHAEAAQHLHKIKG